LKGSRFSTVFVKIDDKIIEKIRIKEIYKVNRNLLYLKIRSIRMEPWVLNYDEA